MFIYWQSGFCISLTSIMMKVIAFIHRDPEWLRFLMTLDMLIWKTTFSVIILIIESYLINILTAFWCQFNVREIIFCVPFDGTLQSLFYLAYTHLSTLGFPFITTADLSKVPTYAINAIRGPMVTKLSCIWFECVRCKGHFYWFHWSD